MARPQRARGAHAAGRRSRHLVCTSLQRVSGDALSGTYNGGMTLPAGGQAGEWKARLVASDGPVNSIWLCPADLDAQSGAGSAEVASTATTWDSEPPKITSLSITSTEVNTESATQVLTVTAPAYAPDD